MPDTPEIPARPVAPMKAAVPAPPDPPLPPHAPAKPDAILCKSTYPRLSPGQDKDRHRWLKEEFAPILGTPLIYSRYADPGHSVTLITGQPNDARGRGVTRYFGSSHPLAGHERYKWTDRGDGVLYGTLTPEAIADEQDQS
jgi:hypothetical protein